MHPVYGEMYKCDKYWINSVQVEMPILKFSHYSFYEQNISTLADNSSEGILFYCIRQYTRIGSCLFGQTLFVSDLFAQTLFVSDKLRCLE